MSHLSLYMYVVCINLFVRPSVRPPVLSYCLSHKYFVAIKSKNKTTTEYESNKYDMFILLKCFQMDFFRIFSSASVKIASFCLSVQKTQTTFLLFFIMIFFTLFTSDKISKLFVKNIFLYYYFLFTIHVA